MWGGGVWQECFGGVCLKSSTFFTKDRGVYCFSRGVRTSTSKQTCDFPRMSRPPMPPLDSPMLLNLLHATLFHLFLLIICSIPFVNVYLQSKSKNRGACLNDFVRSKLLLVYKFEPVYEISNNVVCATSKASDQPAHTRSLIRAFTSSLSTLWLLSHWPNVIWSF